MKLFPANWNAFIVPGVTWATFFLAAAIFYAVQHYRSRAKVTLIGMVKHCFPFTGWTSKSNVIDIVMYVVSKLIFGTMAIGEAALGTAVAGGVSYILTQLLPGYAPLAPGAVAIFIASAALFLAADFANFLTHLLQHKVAFLWELHKVHHSATFLTPFTTKRMHPLGDKLDSVTSSLFAGFIGGFVMFFGGFSLAEMFAMAAAANMLMTFLVLDALRHSHFPVSFGSFDRVLMSPHMHHLHHSAKYEHWDKNLGNKLSIWDWMFGTAVIPAKDEVLTYGVGRGAEVDRDYTTFFGVYIRPATEMVMVMFGRRSRHEIPPPASVLAAEQAAEAAAKAAAERAMPAGDSGQPAIPSDTRPALVAQAG